MSDTENDIPASAPEKGSLQEAVSRGWGGIVSGAQTGALIALGLAGAFLGVDALTGALSQHIATDLGGIIFSHGGSQLGAMASFTGLHCLGAAAFEGACEAYDGFKGTKEERDHIRDTAENIDHKFLELEGAPAMIHAKANAYQFDNPQPKTSPVIQTLVAQGATQQQAEQWRERLAAQQLAQITQDRTV